MAFTSLSVPAGRHAVVRGRRAAVAAALLTTASLAACSAPVDAPGALTSTTAVGAAGAAGAGPAAPGESRPDVAPGAQAVRTAGAATDATSDGADGTADGEGTGFTIAATGDFLVHDAVAARAAGHGVRSGLAYDFRPLFAAVRPVLSAADLALCHVETPMSATNRDLAGYPVFNAPREAADGLRWAGYDGCSTASNHSLDRGMAGVRSTLANLDRVGLGHTGTARNAAEAARTRVYRVRGARVAHLSSTYGTNGVRVPVPWAVNITRLATVLADARRARSEGADLVVVSLHWGTEYRTSPDAGQRRLARALLASPDVDLILGAHAHVQQPVERVGGKYVVYGMGNILSNQSPARGLRPETQDSSVVTAHVVRRGDRYAVARVTYTPTFCDVRTHVVHPVLAALADPRTSADLRARLRASLARTTAIQTAPAPGVRGAVLAGRGVPD